MKDEYLAKHFAQRRAVMEQICACPEKFKVCTNCLSIRQKWVGLCPVCHSYRWLQRPEAVLVLAEFGKKVPWPRSAGIVPRLNGGIVQFTNLHLDARGEFAETPEGCDRPLGENLPGEREVDHD